MSKKKEVVREVPVIKPLESAFGCIDHLPPMSEIPAEFKEYPSNNPYCKMTSDWFYEGLKKPQIDSLIPKKGVDKVQAFKALGAILRSWEPKHEHKEAGVAYLMSQWFDIKK